MSVNALEEEFSFCKICSASSSSSCLFPAPSVLEGALLTGFTTSRWLIIVLGGIVSVTLFQYFRSELAHLCFNQRILFFGELINMPSSGLGDNLRLSTRETRITMPATNASYLQEESVNMCNRTKIASYVTCSVFVFSALFVGFWAAF